MRASVKRWESKGAGLKVEKKMVQRLKPVMGEAGENTTEKEC